MDLAPFRLYNIIGKLLDITFGTLYRILLKDFLLKDYVNISRFTEYFQISFRLYHCVIMQNHFLILLFNFQLYMDFNCKSFYLMFIEISIDSSNTSRFILLHHYFIIQNHFLICLFQFSKKNINRIFQVFSEFTIPYLPILMQAIKSSTKLLNVKK